MDDYVTWREACVVLPDAYENWKRAGREDAKLAFSEYTPALNCEEEAAALYQQSVERLAAITRLDSGAEGRDAMTDSHRSPDIAVSGFPHDDCPPRERTPSLS